MMDGPFNRTTLIILASSLLLAILVVHPATATIMPLSLIARGMHVGDLLFHEMGHALFSWLFGIPSVPMIFTLFNADQAGGFNLQLSDRQWWLQIAVLAGMVYGCKSLRDRESGFFIPAIAFTLLIVVLSLTRYVPLIGYYMGHGTSITIGGFFLYRAILYLDARGAFERWLNGFFGFYLLAANIAFSYGLAFDAIKRNAYENLMMFGAYHHDFTAIAEQYPPFTIAGVAQSALVYCLLSAATAVGLSYYRRNDY